MVGRREYPQTLLAKEWGEPFEPRVTDTMNLRTKIAFLISCLCSLGGNVVAADPPVPKKASKAEVTTAKAVAQPLLPRMPTSRTVRMSGKYSTSGKQNRASQRRFCFSSTAVAGFRVIRAVSAAA